ncbi:MAG TPA: Gldg family protein [Aggregatilineales bacterium]|nr:Gldg family protein [Anaerolineales bacterium]HRE46484.1 Gldg family protein [Aggregatilineales bacterium]
MANELPARRGFMLNRLSFARLASGVGAAALILSGAILITGGGITPLTVLSAVLGVGGLLLYILLAPDDFRLLIQGRRAVYGSNSLLISVLFTGVMILLVWVARLSAVAVDLTSLRYYSLKSDVRPIMANLNRPIQITAFHSRQLLGQKSVDTPILQMFSDAAPDKVKIVLIDPDEQPLTARNFGLNAAYGLFVSYLNTDGTADTRPAGTVQVRGDYANEKWIAEAILQLQAKGNYKVVFSTGGNEVSLQTDATGIRDGLASVGIAVGTVDLLNEDIPADTTALVILAPWIDYPQPVVTKIAVYLAGGGKLLLMAEPSFDSRITFIQRPDSPLAVYLWETWGVRPQRDIVFDPLSYDVSRYYVRAARYFEGHPIVVKDETGAVSRPLFVITQSWEVGSADNVTATILYQTTDQAFGKLNLQEVAADPDRAERTTGDLGGPLTLAAAFENDLNGARLIVVGDADWIRNDQIVAFDGQYLWTDMIDWLTRFLERITVNPVAIPLPLNVSTAELNIAALITIILVPGVILLTGSVVWWRRTRR